jgi:hypothetical protein
MVMLNFFTATALRTPSFRHVMQAGDNPWTGIPQLWRVRFARSVDSGHSSGPAAAWNLPNGGAEFLYRHATDAKFSLRYASY